MLYLRQQNDCSINNDNITSIAAQGATAKFVLKINKHEISPPHDYFTLRTVLLRQDVLRQEPPDTGFAQLGKRFPAQYSVRRIRRTAKRRARRSRFGFTRQEKYVPTQIC